jgi:dTDP-glucose pyrophosphorylase
MRTMTRPITDYLVSPTASVRDTLACIDRNGCGIALVVDDERRLLGTVTDGDLRRAILAGRGLEECVADAVLARRPGDAPPPATMAAGAPAADVIALMDARSIRQVPLLDGDGRVVALALREELQREGTLDLQAMIMVGGFGKRLRPLTEDIPKPMLPVGDRPLLERVVEQLRDAGVRRVSMATHYRGDVIRNHFGDGSRFGVSVEYLLEEEPLGTAGALRLLRAWDSPVLVMNGDLLTGLNFRAFHSFHRQQRAAMTVGVREYEVRVPYGVVETSGVMVQRVVEKPLMRYFVNGGIYLISPEVAPMLPPGGRLDMPDLINRLAEEARGVVGYPIREYWLDIGQMEDYQRANADLREGRV